MTALKIQEEWEKGQKKEIKMAYVYVHNDGWELGDMSPVEYGQRLMDVPQDNGHSNILVNSLRICSCNKLSVFLL